MEKFVDISGAPNPKGRYCQACHLRKVEQKHRAALAREQSCIRKLKIVYGKYWRHYAAPEHFHATLQDERDFCPYCGTRFDDVIPDPFNESPVHIDHMDPLDKGGEHSIRNVVLCCGPCNIKKGKRSFMQWLEMLEPPCRDLAKTLYVEKHGHPPEAFVEGCPTARNAYELELALYQSEAALKKQYPQPKVNGPPSNQPTPSQGGDAPPEEPKETSGGQA
ncbi:HNH endonuclease [Syntrophotalea carbinolica]|uniref:HNH endonuclease n=1 Tax=Syntrophotalea carbinolica TaxID=19 RepID=UPI00130E8878|nr:HNH endonuclease [Syntrophotalea carbinolica]